MPVSRYILLILAVAVTVPVSAQQNAWGDVTPLWEPWAQNAVTQQGRSDSVYVAARVLVSRGEWRKAADAFATVATRNPASPLKEDAMYWQAFALYRIGGTTELQEARTVLDSRKRQFPNSRSNSEADILTVRVNSALTARGVRGVAGDVAISQGTGQCDAEEASVRAAALNALRSLNSERSREPLVRALANRDECSVPLRRNVVVLLAADSSAESRALLASVIRNDPSPRVRVEALGFYGRFSGTDVVNVLSEVATKPQEDIQVRRAAVSALGTHVNASARRVITGIISNRGEQESLRLDAVSALERGGQKRTTVAGFSAAAVASPLNRTGGRVQADRTTGRVQADRISGQVEATRVEATRAEVDKAIVARTLAVSKQPLVVIDGVVSTNGIDIIDPSRIKSVEVVRGVAAQRIYGARADNGVIQISTQSQDNDWAKAAGISGDSWSTLTRSGFRVDDLWTSGSGGGWRISSEDSEWLRSNFSSLDTPALKIRAISVLARAGDAATQSWLAQLIASGRESADIQSSVLSRIGREMPVDQLVMIYDRGTDRAMRRQVITLLGLRDDTVATDKLIDIVRTGTDPTLRSAAITALGRKNDARTTQLLLDLIGQP